MIQHFIHSTEKERNHNSEKWMRSFRKYFCLCSLTSQIEWWLLTGNKCDSWRCFKGTVPKAEQLSVELKPPPALCCLKPTQPASVNFINQDPSTHNRWNSVYIVSSPTSFLHVSKDAPDPAVNPHCAFRRSLILLFSPMLK